ncbi:hypothetical protein ACPPVO_34840 [Dactylosporangium sp. McL0621]|uniref:hypothetical protein n=1 Tax=Dactylosporangium sp. McL0621 TaxID=3415678 RepID=UPI003CF6F485
MSPRRTVTVSGARTAPPVGALAVSSPDAGTTVAGGTATVCGAVSMAGVWTAAAGAVAAAWPVPGVAAVIRTPARAVTAACSRAGSSRGTPRRAAATTSDTVAATSHTHTLQPPATPSAANSGQPIGCATTAAGSNPASSGRWMSNSPTGSPATPISSTTAPAAAPAAARARASR